MSEKPDKNDQSLPDIFQRLAQRRIDYAGVKRVVQFDTPQNTLFFVQWFKGRTIKQVLQQFEKWHEFLDKEFVLSLFGELKSEVQQRLGTTEGIVVHTLIEANPYVGPWNLRIKLLPTGTTEEGQLVYINSPRQIVAVHRKTKKKRTAQIAGESGVPPISVYKEAFEKLELWDSLWKGDPSRRLISKRAQQGYPLYTRLIIPRLYEFLAPKYQSAGHHWARHGNAHSNRLARFPEKLFEDMLEILRLEHPDVFGQTTLPVLKAVVQRHLARKKTK